MKSKIGLKTLLAVVLTVSIVADIQASANFPLLTTENVEVLANRFLDKADTPQISAVVKQLKFPWQDKESEIKNAVIAALNAKIQEPAISLEQVVQEALSIFQDYADLYNLLEKTLSNVLTVKPKIKTVKKASPEQLAFSNSSEYRREILNLNDQEIEEWAKDCKEKFNFDSSDVFPNHLEAAFDIDMTEEQIENYKKWSNVVITKTNQEIDAFIKDFNREKTSGCFSKNKQRELYERAMALGLSENPSQDGFSWASNNVQQYGPQWTTEQILADRKKQQSNDSGNTTPTFSTLLTTSPMTVSVKDVFTQSPSNVLVPYRSREQILGKPQQLPELISDQFALWVYNFKKRLNINCMGIFLFSSQR